jgi:hypothetical protein
MSLAAFFGCLVRLSGQLVQLCLAILPSVLARDNGLSSVRRFRWRIHTHDEMNLVYSCDARTIHRRHSIKRTIAEC